MRKRSSNRQRASHVAEKKKQLLKPSACQGANIRNNVEPQHLPPSRYRTKLTSKPTTLIKFAVGIIPTYAVRRARKFYQGFYENTKYL